MIKLSEISTKAPEGWTKSETRKKSKELARKIGDLQRILYAQDKYSLLVVFQGMDASGKDGAVRKTFRYCSPSGIGVHSFKKPSSLEFSHDFLWRVHKEAPQKGMIKIFNRSHYEDILIQRVHGWIDEERVRQRMQAINAFEELLQFDNNTVVLKFYMHLSREQQRIELQERIDDPNKQWKHNPGDWEEAKLWDEYRGCYEYAISHSTIPWTIVPVDQRWYRDFVVAKTILETLENLPLELPKLQSESISS